MRVLHCGAVIALPNQAYLPQKHLDIGLSNGIGSDGHLGLQLIAASIPAWCDTTTHCRCACGVHFGVGGTA